MHPDLSVHEAAARVVPLRTPTWPPPLVDSASTIRRSAVPARVRPSSHPLLAARLLADPTRSWRTPFGWRAFLERSFTAASTSAAPSTPHGACARPGPARVGHRRSRRTRRECDGRALATCPRRPGAAAVAISVCGAAGSAATGPWRQPGTARPPRARRERHRSEAAVGTRLESTRGSPFGCRRKQRT